jgi:hypothetical protein
MIKIAAKERGVDKWGSGEFGAPRGKRTHAGIDYRCRPTSQILSPCIGIVTKLGYPYADDLSFRYIEIKREDNLFFRVFYVKPLVEVFELVEFDTIIGTSQSLTGRYPDITEHVHFEIKDEDGVLIDPKELLG